MDAVIDQWCYRLASLVPYASLQNPGFSFLHRAFVGLLLLAPLCATIGIQVINFRLAFFAEAVGHSAFTGIALGLGLAAALGQAGPGSGAASGDTWALGAMVIFGVLVALAITFYRRQSGLAGDTVIGVFSAAIMALGLCLITHMMSTNRIRGGDALRNFLIGNILTIDAGEVAGLAAFFLLAMTFQALAYNRLLFLGINAALAKTRGVRVAAYEYAFAALLALVVMFSIEAVGALLVTAMLVIPAAAARNLARSAGGLFWWAQGIAASSGVGGLILSDYFNTATGATTVLAATLWFLASSISAWWRGQD